LLHIITAFECALIIAIAPSLESHPQRVAVLMLACLFPLFTQLDARSRFQEFKKVRDQLIRYGPRRRIFRSVSRSRCQRDAALAAAGRLGYTADCREFFCAAGYRWYHLLPDIVIRQPVFCLSAAFWRATFFAPTYRARYPLESRKTGSSGPPELAGQRCSLPVHYGSPDSD
jgi:hypothetical protein